MNGTMEELIVIPSRLKETLKGVPTALPLTIVPRMGCRLTPCSLSISSWVSLIPMPRTEMKSEFDLEAEDGGSDEQSMVRGRSEWVTKERE